MAELSKKYIQPSENLYEVKMPVFTSEEESESQELTLHKRNNEGCESLVPAVLAQTQFENYDLS